MTQEELIAICNKWINGWNERNIPLLLDMVIENSRLAGIHSFFDPIFFEQTALRDKNYLQARFKRDVDILEANNLKFKEPYKIKVGDFFIDMQYQMSNNLYVHEILSLTEGGKIDQVYRNIDNIAFT